MSYLVFFDLDDTIINGQSQKLFVRYLFKKNKINFFVYFYVILWFVFYKMKLVKNVKKIREKVFKVCNGWSDVFMRELILDFFNLYIKERIHKNFFDLLNYHKKRGAKTILLSAAIYPIVKTVADFLELDFCIATKLKIQKGIYTGEIDGDIIYGLQKKDAIVDFVKDNNFSFKGSYAYGDHISDLYLLSIVENPVIVNPGHYMIKLAEEKQWNTILLN